MVLTSLKIILHSTVTGARLPSATRALSVAYADFERLTGPTVADIAVARSA
jgi:hypothetical protein